MMSNEVVNALTVVAQRLASLATDDDQIRREVRRLALAVLAATDTPQVENSAGPSIVVFPANEPRSLVGKAPPAAGSPDSSSPAAGRGTDELVGSLTGS